MITLLLAAAFRIESVTMPTYPYSDPDPVPTAEPQRYPYFRYDGQSAVSRPQAWEAVKLSNGRIEVTAIPAIGGKVWGAKDLVTGRDFIYANDAVKFRDIALRGPWCSGGIEFNFGITGHAPWTVSPVDWTVRTNGDASASYFFGGYEFVTRTWWQVEVVLRDGEDFFTTRMTWHNSGGQPCTRYQWSTSAVTARGNPRMVYPGANQINHDGTAYPWPRDDRGVDRSRYANDGDLEAVSWHVMNGDNRFFGIWYPDWKTGMWHRNAAEDKFGRKIFMWSQARSGGIWEDLLTDRAGQYIELQSGRGMQQQVGGCEKTPFKFQTLVPGATDTFEEQWGVARDTKPFDEAGTFPCGEIARPLVFPRDYDTNGVYALYRDGEQKMRYGQDVAGAAKLLERALAKDPCFVPALGELAAFELRRGNVAKAERLAEKALAVDTYDGPANFVSGEIALDAGRLERARERFGVAALDAALRPAALVRLGMVAVREKDYALAAGLAGKALACSAYDPEAHQLAAAAARLAGDRVSAMKAVKDGFVRTPVHYGLKYENLLLGASEPLTRCELPGPTLVETGLWYAKAGLADEAKRIWAMAPRSPVAKLLSGDLKGAAALPVDLVFPHGRETIAALERAMGESPSWKFKYYLAIALAPFGETVRSDALLEACGNEPDAAVFYLCRAARRTGTDALADLKRAAALDDSWRVGCALAKTYLKDKRPDEAFAAADAYRRRYPGMQQLDAAAVTALIEAKRFKEALAILERINVLPSEFNKAVPAQWNRCHRALAEAALASGDKATAKKHVEAALSFPENLGDGRPVKPLSVLDDWPAELRELVIGKRADGTFGTKWVPETPIPAPVATYARNAGEALEVTFVAERGDGRLTLRVDPVAHTATFAERTGTDAQEKILQRVGDVRGLARAYAVRLVACYDRKADATVFDAEIAGDRTLIAARCGRWTARAARCAGEATRIDCGRQLFVDDALTGESRGVERHWNRPVKRRDPLVWPSGGAGAAARGKGRAPAGLTCATDGGLWWDPKLRRYRLWYQADWCGDACYAESADGETWTYPELGAVKGTNRLFAEDDLDSWCVVPDYAAADPYAKWCLYISAPGGITRNRLWTSRDGKAFEPCGTGGWSGDRSTVYYDPFRTNWVFSLRDYRKEGRVRRYFAAKDFASARWSWPKMWGHRDPASHEKEPRPDEWLVATNRPNWALYNFDAVAYESVMLGVMEVLYNTPGDNEDCMKTGLPKQTGLHFCFSRDGRTYVPRDEPDLAPEGWGSGAWDTGYLSPVAGICTVGEEEIRIHYSGLRGDGRITATDRWEDNGMYVNGAIGCAVLRRDGFAGMVADGNGELVTKPVTFSGKHLFVNADCRFGELRVEVLGDDGEALPGFTAADCVPFAGESACKREITWKGGTLASFAARPVRFRFKIGCGTLYAFWVSPSSRGESRGYVAAGGPAYPGLRDL